jgi:hypothetical protein
MRENVWGRWMVQVIYNVGVEAGQVKYDGDCGRVEWEGGSERERACGEGEWGQQRARGKKSAKFHREDGREPGRGMILPFIPALLLLGAPSL